ncbi:MAG: maleylacetoacetate isomerase, partial [Gammaproteobacteria bacterium]|nr:maleylacetoacetate isomerase [Gammaproteobacteria bacterium]
MKLYTYFRSSAAYRVRIALNLKGVTYDSVPVDLVAGQQSEAEHLVRNPLGLVPVLETSGQRLSQSLAIIEYLEEMHPHPPLLPADAPGRARVRGMALAVACDTHPLNNMSVLRFLTDELGVDQAGRDRWYRHWVERCFAALEASVDAAPYCVGGTVSLADVCLVPQVFNARRFSVPLTRYPKLVAIDVAMAAIDAVAAAH